MRKRCDQILTVPPFKLVYLSNCDQHEHEAKMCISVLSTCFAKRLTIHEDVYNFNDEAREH